MNTPSRFALLLSLVACGSPSSGPSTGSDASAHDAGTDAPAHDAGTDAPAEPDGGALPPPACFGPTDCRLFADTCGTCKCIALTKTAPDPTCSDPVACLVDPCQGKSAECTNNTCTVQ